MSITNLSTALASLGTGSLLALGNHLTQSQELQAVSVLDSMYSNPAAAAPLLPSLTAITGLPAVVMSDVESAVAAMAGATPDIATFKTDIQQAKSALLTAVTSPTTLGSLFSAL